MISRDDLLHVVGHGDAIVAHVEVQCFLLHDLDLLLEIFRIVRADLRAVAVFQRRDDAAAIRVVLGVRGRNEENVERQTHAVSADLDVALFEHVEQADLNPLGEVRQFVDGEDAPVDARQQSVVDRQFVGQIASFGDFDRIHLADQIGDRDVGRCEFFAVAFVAMHPADRCRVAFRSDELFAGRGNRLERIFRYLDAVEHRRPFVEQRDERAQNPRLGLAAFAEQDQILARQQRVLQLRQHGVVVADDARKQRFALAQFFDQVFAQFGLDRQHLIAGSLQFSKSRGSLGQRGSLMRRGGASIYTELARSRDATVAQRDAGPQNVCVFVSTPSNRRPTVSSVLGATMMCCVATCTSRKRRCKSDVS